MPVNASLPRIPVDARGFHKRLRGWYARCRRPLPWRETGDPYRIWVSEVMLQQTRVDVVTPRYMEFLARFPTLSDLAAASESEVTAAWSGLGYYRRARNLHAAARILTSGGHAEFPRALDRALSLPGVGAYIARAVLSIAYGARCAVVDGNVRRVLARLLALSDPSPRTLQMWADNLLDPLHPGEANQAMMELGAIVCLPVSPRCPECPVRIDCAASRAGRVGEFPAPRRRPRTESRDTTIFILRDRRGRVWLESRRRPPLEGLWMLPWRSMETSAGLGRALGSIAHTIMSRRYRCAVYSYPPAPESVPGEPAGPGAWVAPDRIRDLPRSALLTKALALQDEKIGAQRRSRSIRSGPLQEETEKPASSERRARSRSKRGKSEGSRNPRSA